VEFVNFMREEAFRKKVERLFEEQKNRIQSLLPEADIQHIGSTAIPNSLTKGDLDIQVRIPAELFTVAVSKLSKIYDTNDGSHRSARLRHLRTIPSTLHWAFSLRLSGVRKTSFGSSVTFLRPMIITGWSTTI
jgi:GrpB-like predicted nucleotidyltransferase (UPF0157 family)